MKVCFDLRALQIGHENRGIGMFAKTLLEHLPKDDHVEYIFYAFDKGDPVKELGVQVDINYRLITTKSIKTTVEQPKDFIGMLRLINHRFSNLRSLKPDAFVQFDFNLGVPKWGNTKNIVFGYDLVPLMMKTEYLQKARFTWSKTTGIRSKLRAALRAWYYQLRYRLSYRIYKRADKIICISKSTAESFKDLLDLPSKKLSVVHLAPVISKNSPDFTVAEKINKPFLLYVGGTDRRKGIQDIVYSFNFARSRGVNLALVLAGKEFRGVSLLPNIEAREAILGSPFRDDIHLVGFVNDKEKRGLYDKAYAFIFCSSYEGFGMPLLEAMSEGCPVVSYDNSSIPEIVGSAALLSETHDFVGIGRNILKLEDASIRKQIKSKGFKQVKKFSWHQTTLKILEEIKTIS